MVIIPARYFITNRYLYDMCLTNMGCDGMVGIPPSLIRDLQLKIEKLLPKNRLCNARIHIWSDINVDMKH